MTQYFKVSKRIEELAKGVDSATNKQLYNALKQYRQLDEALTKLYRRNFNKKLAELEKEQADLVANVRSFNPFKYSTTYKGKTPIELIIDEKRLDTMCEVYAKAYVHTTHMDIFFDKEEQEKILATVKAYVLTHIEEGLHYTQNEIIKILGSDNINISIDVKKDTPDVAWMFRLNPALKTHITAADIYRYKARIRAMQKCLASMTETHRPFLYRYNTPEMDVEVLSRFYKGCENMLQGELDEKYWLTPQARDIYSLVNSLDTTAHDAAAVTAEYSKIFKTMQQEMSKLKLSSNLRTLYKAGGGQPVKSSFSAVKLKDLMKQLDAYKEELQKIAEEIAEYEELAAFNEKYQDESYKADIYTLEQTRKKESAIKNKITEAEVLNNVLNNSPLPYLTQSYEQNKQLLRRKKAIQAKLVTELKKLRDYLSTAINYRVQAKAQIDSANDVYSEITHYIQILKSPLTSSQLYNSIQGMQLTLDRISKTFTAPKNANEQIKVLLSIDELINLDGASRQKLLSMLNRLGPYRKSNRHYHQTVKAWRKQRVSEIQTQREFNTTGEDIKKRAEQLVKQEKQRKRHERIEQLSISSQYKVHTRKWNERIVRAFETSEMRYKMRPKMLAESVDALKKYTQESHAPMFSSARMLADIAGQQFNANLANTPRVPSLPPLRQSSSSADVARFVRDAFNRHMGITPGITAVIPGAQYYDNMPTLMKLSPEAEQFARELESKKQTKARNNQIYEMMERQAAQTQSQIQAMIEQPVEMPNFLEKKSSYSYEDLYTLTIRQIFYYFVQLLGLYTPTDSGNLIESFEYKLEDTYFRAWFDMKKAPYAVRQHEETTYHHPTGCAKFMEKAIWQAVGSTISSAARSNYSVYIPVFICIRGYTEVAKALGAHDRFTRFINETGSAGPELSVTVGLSSLDNIGALINAQPGRYNDIISSDITGVENVTQLVKAQRTVMATSAKINELKQLLGISSKDIDQNMINNLLYNRQLNYKWAEKLRQIPRPELIAMCRGFVKDGHATEAIGIMITVDKLAPRRMQVVNYMSQLANTARR